MGVLDDLIYGVRKIFTGSTPTQVSERDTLRLVAPLSASDDSANGRTNIQLDGSAVTAGQVLFGGKGHNVETITGTKTLVVTDSHWQYLTPSGADRGVQLPAEASSDGMWFVISQTTESGYDLTVKDDGGTTIASCPPMSMLIVNCDGTTWTTQGLFERRDIGVFGPARIKRGTTDVTGGAGATTVDTHTVALAVAAGDGEVFVRITAVAVDEQGAAAFYHKWYSHKVIAGTLGAANNIDATIVDEDDSSWDIATANSGNDLQLQVTPDAEDITSFRWHWEVTEVAVPS